MLNFTAYRVKRITFTERVILSILLYETECILNRQTHPLSPRIMTFNKVFFRDDEAMLAIYTQTHIYILPINNINVSWFHR